MNSVLSRRLFLRGLGAAVCLPALESARQLSAAPKVARALATTASGAPLRMAYFYVPNGVNVAKWKSGETLAPLQAYRDQYSLINGLEVEKATAGGDGGGSHARGSAAFLTGVRPRKTAGSDIALGQSIDQYTAERLGDVTRFRSLELGTDNLRKAGACDGGYSCAYQFNLSWRSENTPMTPEANPRLLFERLFGSGTRAEREENQARRLGSDRSILDFVNQDAKDLQREIGGNDREKLDEYLTSVREIERRIQLAEKWPLPDVDGVESPAGVPSSYQEHLRLMFDMLLLAFETDSTRVATFALAYEGSNRSFGEIGVPDGHHRLSHHDRLTERLDKIAKIDLFYTQQLAYFLERAAAKRDSDGKSILDNSMFLYGSSMSDGNRHAHSDLPVILAGGGGGVLNPGQDVTLPTSTPITNLYLRMMNEMGVSAERFGDSSGVLNFG